MIKLSRRLEQLADLLPSQMERFIDVGCDHALLALAMLERGRAKNVLAIDINEGPLARARANAQKYGLEDKIKIKLNSGLRQIELKASDMILIAGLGGNEIKSILEQSSPKLGQLVLIQVNWHWTELRRYMAEHGWVITREHVIREGQRLYPIIESKYTATPYQLTRLEEFCGPSILKQVKSETGEKDLYLLWIGELCRIAEKKSRSGQRRDSELLREIEDVITTVARCNNNQLQA